MLSIKVNIVQKASKVLHNGLRADFSAALTLLWLQVSFAVIQVLDRPADLTGSSPGPQHLIYNDASGNGPSNWEVSGNAFERIELSSDFFYII